MTYLSKSFKPLSIIVIVLCMVVHVLAEKLQFYFSGDVVFNGPNRVNLTILDSDDAYGVFHFDAPFSQNVEEGSTVKYA